jgi:hypothetical protein
MRRLVGAAYLVALLLLALVTAGSADTRRLVDVRVPNGVYLGAFVAYGPRWTGSSGAADAFGRFESLIRAKLAVENRFYGWAESFPTELQRRDVAAGRIPMITWKAPRLDRILDGSQDALITSRARAVRAFGSALFIRWGWEMNGTWTEWSGASNNTPGTHDGPAKFVRAWRRVHDIFARIGATNVSWVWAPNATSIPATAWNAAAAYYPGDAYVDWIGFSAYNWGTGRTWSHWSSFRSLVAPFYRRWARRKPLIVAETSTAGGPRKSRWIEGIVPALAGFPRLKAVLLFQQPPRWDVTEPVQTLDALRALARARVFRRP